MMSRATEKYGDLTNGGKVEVEFTKEEACAVLFAHDYGIDVRWDESSKFALYSAIAKLKDQIWP